MRVVQVSFYVDPQGNDPEDLLDAWGALTVTAEAAVHAGFDVSVVQASTVERRVARGGVTYHFTEEHAPGPLRRRLGRWAAPITPRVIERAASFAPDLVHVHGLSYPRHVLRLTQRLPDVPILLQDHADRPPPRWRRAGYRAATDRIAGVLFTASVQAAPLFRSDALPAGLPVFQVPESTSRFTPAPQESARTLIGIDGDPSLLWVGRLDANKDPLTVLDAFSRAAPALPRARLWMCWTEAPLLRRVRARIAEDPILSARVTLLGPRSRADVQRLLQAADFLVLGSHKEGSGYAVIEALACGTTPLVTDIPSFRLITGDGSVGALSPPGAADKMAGAMVAWGTKPRAPLRAAALAHFARHLSIPAIGEQLAAAYRAVVAAAVPTPLPEPRT